MLFVLFYASKAFGTSFSKNTNLRLSETPAVLVMMFHVLDERGTYFVSSGACGQGPLINEAAVEKVMFYSSILFLAYIELENIK